MRTLVIYEECDSGLEFKKIRSFLQSSFGNLDAQIIKTKKRVVHTKGIIFDFTGTQRAFSNTYREPKNTCNIILTDKIFATLDDDKRPHIRAAIYSFPSVISLVGIIEGPAKPREFYIYKQRYSALGVWQLEESEIKGRFKNQFIDYQDPRMTEVVKGYIAQAVFFYMTGNPFCENRNCRLFNAHWQKDLIYSQIACGRFCRQHSRILDGIKTNG